LTKQGIAYRNLLLNLFSGRSRGSVVLV